MSPKKIAAIAAGVALVAVLLFPELIGHWAGRVSGGYQMGEREAIRDGLGLN